MTTYTYAYDGSGVALRCAAELVTGQTVEHTFTLHDVAQTTSLVLVRFAEFVPPLDRFSELPSMVEGLRWVDPRKLDQPAHVASFNWLD